MDHISIKSKAILDALQHDDCDIDKMVREYFQCLGNVDKVPEFLSDLEWVNSKPHSFNESLKGKFVLLDFFTYCCINCMHIIPYLNELEDQIPPNKGLVIIGVHSGKFGNEKNSSNIQNALLRYKIHHPVINDCNYAMWNAYNIVCWPTLVLINTYGEVCLIAEGEGDVKNLMKFVKCAVKLFETTPYEIDHLTQEKNTKKSSVISYPGKVYYSVDRNTIFISDTTNNRVIETNLFGQILSKFDTFDLDGPQDILVFKDKLYICDTNHHQIKSVDLISLECSIVCGTGKQGGDLEGGKTGIQQEISSPWGLEIIDLNVVPPCEGLMLVICMAGTHQIWGYALTDVIIINRSKRESYKKCTTWRIAGSGVEGNKNNSYPHKANFAQPSGITFDTKKLLYIADSESSTIRSMELPSFAVKNVAGGEVDPTNLFAFGDVDDKGTSAKLQHPIGVINIGESILVADSYNHKLKEIDPKTRIVKTIKSVVDLAEPSGLAFDKFSGQVYIADTNNHQIKIFNPVTGVCESLVVVDRNNFIRNAGVTFLKSCNGTLKLLLIFKNKLNKDGNSNIKLSCFSDGKFQITDITINEPEVELPCMEVNHGAMDLLITLYTCSSEGSCFMNRYNFRINFSTTCEDKSNLVKINLF